MIRRVLTSVGVLTAAVVLIASAGTASAQANKAQVNRGNGLRIAPVRNDLTIKPGSSQTVDLYLQNISGSPAQLKGIVNDFIASDDESGEPRPVLDSNSPAIAHGLKQYIEPLGDVSLQPQEQKIIKVKVSIPANAAGGGYFGLVRFLPNGVDSSKNVSLSASVGSLFLVTVPGDIKEQASVVGFNVARPDGDKVGKASNLFTDGSKDSKGKGLQVSIRVRNNGNVQVAPFGKIQLKKSGKVIAEYELNNLNPRGNVLPDSIRRFTVDLGDKTSSIGKYTLEGNFGYGNKGQLVSASTSFVVVPLAYILLAVGLLLIIISALLIAPRWLKSHDRKLLRKVRRK